MERTEREVEIRGKLDELRLTSLEVGVLPASEREVVTTM